MFSLHGWTYFILILLQFSSSHSSFKIVYSQSKFSIRPKSNVRHFFQCISALEIFFSERYLRRLNDSKDFFIQIIEKYFQDEKH